MDGLAYHPIAQWWNNFVGQGVWTELFSSIPIVVLLVIGMLLLQKLTKFISKMILIAVMIAGIIVLVVIFNPFGITDMVLSFL